MHARDRRSRLDCERGKRVERRSRKSKEEGTRRKRKGERARRRGREDGRDSARRGVFLVRSDREAEHELLLFCSRFSFPVYTPAAPILTVKSKRNGTRTVEEEGVIVLADLLRLKSRRGGVRTHCNCDGSLTPSPCEKRLYNTPVGPRVKFDFRAYPEPTNNVIQSSGLAKPDVFQPSSQPSLVT